MQKTVNYHKRKENRMFKSPTDIGTTALSGIQLYEYAVSNFLTLEFMVRWQVWLRENSQKCKSVRKFNINAKG